MPGTMKPDGRHAQASRFYNTTTFLSAEAHLDSDFASLSILESNHARSIFQRFFIFGPSPNEIKNI